MEKRKSQFWTWSWVDFANSLLYTNLILYIPTLLTIDRGINDLHYNIIFVISTLLAIIFAPILGIRADLYGKRLIYLRFLNLLVIFFGFVIGIVGLYSSSLIGAYIIGIFFMLLNTSYLLSLQFYDSMLPDIENEKNLTKGSAIGFSMGWIGAIVGVLTIIPIASLDIENSRIYAILVATILGSLVLIPALFKLKDIQIKRDNTKNISFKNFISIIYKKPIMWFLIAYFIFMDAILTIQDNLSIYLEKIFYLGDDVKGLFAVVIIIAGVVGALITILMKIKNIKKWLIYLILIASLFTIMTSIIESKNISMILLVLAFVVFGSIISLSRAFFSYLSDETYRSSSFSWYSIAQKSSSLIGPLIWGSIILGWQNYNISLFTMGILLVLSIIPINFLNISKNK